MFEISSRDLITAEARLLYDIRELLVEINKKADIPVNNDKRPRGRPPKVDTATSVKKKEWICPKCGKLHQNQGGYLACARKHKKEGVNNVV